MDKPSTLFKNFIKNTGWSTRSHGSTYPNGTSHKSTLPVNSKLNTRAVLQGHSTPIPHQDNTTGRIRILKNYEPEFLHLGDPERSSAPRTLSDTAPPWVRVPISTVTLPNSSATDPETGTPDTPPAPSISNSKVSLRFSEPQSRGRYSKHSSPSAYSSYSPTYSYRSVERMDNISNPANFTPRSYSSSVRNVVGANSSWAYSPAVSARARSPDTPMQMSSGTPHNELEASTESPGTGSSPSAIRQVVRGRVNKLGIIHSNDNESITRETIMKHLSTANVVPHGAYVPLADVVSLVGGSHKPLHRLYAKLDVCIRLYGEAAVEEVVEFLLQEGLGTSESTSEKKDPAQATIQIDSRTPGRKLELVTLADSKSADVDQRYRRELEDPDMAKFLNLGQECYSTW